MNNLKGYDEFINEEFDFKTFKKKAKLEITFFKAKALLYGLKAVLFWSKNFMGAIDVMDLYFQKVKQFAKFMVKYDDELDELSYTGSEEDLKEFINKIKVDYEAQFNSPFIEDLKQMVEKMLQSKAAIKAKSPKDIKKVNGLCRVLDVISDKAEGHEEEDPYGEEEWSDDNVNDTKRPSPPPRDNDPYGEENWDDRKERRDQNRHNRIQKRIYNRK